MIVSHKYKFIFIKTRKTAGTSVEISLSRYCGPDDIVTRVSPEDERIREEHGACPRNYNVPRGEFGVKDWLRLLIFRRYRKKYYNHIPAKNIRQAVGEKTWDTYYKFCFERNPWDKVISHYHWRNRKGMYENLDQFLESGYAFSQWPLYHFDDKLAVDFIGRFENLNGDLQKVCDRLGIPFDGCLPRSKGRYRKDRRPYQEVLTEGQRDIIERIYAREIDLLDYRYGD